MKKIQNFGIPKIAVIGLGYVGLPLAVEFGKIYNTIGYDINEQRLIDLNNNIDTTLEVSQKELISANLLDFTSNISHLQQCNIYIVTVPTPIDSHNQPNLAPLKSASETIGKVLSKDDIVIYESTVYPGATEEECVPILEKSSNLKFNIDFFVGYSPERINPGDKEHKVKDILKVTSGSSIDTSNIVDNLYKSVITAGTFKASSIKVAEAAKVIENTQRDVNIALINELSIIFNKLEIDTQEVLEAAGTKWNFIPFRPGLVGGHCIGVDPYYLTYKAQAIGYHPEIILSGRRLNDSMGNYIASQTIKEMIKNRVQINQSRVLVMGIAFKENCPDIRNSKVIDIIHELQQYEVDVDVYDPLVDPGEVSRTYGIKISDNLEKEVYSGIILAVAHQDIVDMSMKKIRSLGKSNCVIFDIKSVFNKSDSDIRL